MLGGFFMRKLFLFCVRGCGTRGAWLSEVGSGGYRVGFVHCRSTFVVDLDGF